MEQLEKESNHFIKPPTLDDWIRAKKKRWNSETRISFLRKLRIMETMETLPWEIDEDTPSIEAYQEMRK